MSGKMLAYHFDMKRSMWRAEYIEEMARVLAAWGFTHILYEIEDKFRFADHPAIGPRRGPHS